MIRRVVMILYRIVLSYAVCGVLARGDTIVESAPMVRRHATSVTVLRAWVLGCRGTMDIVMESAPCNRVNGCAIEYGDAERWCRVCGGECDEGDRVMSNEKAPEEKRHLPFVNDHVSVSRLRLFEQCPQAFYRRYVHKDPHAPKGNAATGFGTLLHRALEAAYQQIVNDEIVGPFPVDVALDAFREAWTKSPIPLGGLDVYREGLDILRRYASRRGQVDHMMVLGVERDFTIQLGRFTMVGAIDLLEREDDDTIIVRDYKSNRMMYTRAELDADLQMAIYAFVASQWFPWAKTIKNAFEMLRYGLSQWTSRTPVQLEDAKGYIIATAEKTERDTVWRAVLNKNCGWCDYHASCDTYRAAYEGKHEITRANAADIDGLVKEWAAVATVSKAAYARQMKIQDVLKAKAEQEGPYTAGGHTIRLQESESLRYDPEKTIEAFVQWGMLPRSQVEKSLSSVQKSEVEALLETVMKMRGAGVAQIVRSKVETAAQRIAGTPKFDSRKIKEGQR
jgi:hypothetical protein